MISEVDIPLMDPVVETLKILAGVGYINSNNHKVLKLKSNGSSFLVVLFFA